MAQVEAQSYREIALSLGVDDPSQITFATDVHAEAVAASQAGWTPVLVVRPGNKPLPADAGAQFRIIESLEQLL
jgi:methionine salvage enolase-phosphatase E1